jgi:hypothetical protein
MRAGRSGDPLGSLRSGIIRATVLDGDRGDITAGEVTAGRLLDGRPLWRRLLALFVALHGLGHLAGAGDLLDRARDDRPAHLLGGVVTASAPATVSAVGVAAALVAFGYLGTAVAIWQLDPRWPKLLRTVTIASLVVVVLTLWTSVAGLFIDAALLVVAARAGRTEASAGSGPAGARR